jgi:hypothetical protein
MTKDLNSFIKDNRRFLKLKDGETVRVIYRGYKVAVNPQEPDKELVLYQIQFPDAQQVMSWKSASIVVAEKMATISQGEEITITRHGEGTETKYEIKQA